VPSTSGFDGVTRVALIATAIYNQLSRLIKVEQVEPIRDIMQKVKVLKNPASAGRSCSQPVTIATIVLGNTANGLSLTSHG
jgi:hypothetical protein